MGFAAEKERFAAKKPVFTARRRNVLPTRLVTDPNRPCIAPTQKIAATQPARPRTQREPRPLGAVAEHAPEGALEDRVEQHLTERAATFEPGEFRAVLLEQSVGELSRREALDLSRAMIAERRILPLEGGLMTTLTVCARAQAIERRFTTLASRSGRGPRARKRSDRRADRRTPQRRAGARTGGHHRPRARRDPRRARPPAPAKAS